MKARSPRLSAEDRRKQLLDIALNLFSRKGFQGTTTKEIAAAAGVTEAIIFRHFASKQALYTAVLDYQYESGETAALLSRWKAFMDVNDDAGLFRSIISSVIESHRRDARVKRALLFAALEGHETGLELHRQRSMPVFGLICQYVARRQSEGAIRQGNPSAMAGAAFTMAAHYAMLTQFFGFRTQTTDEETTEDFLDILLHGIQPVLTPEKITQ